MPDFTARRTTMVDTQVRPADVTKFPIIQAMLSIPREAYVPADRIEAAYIDANLDLGGGRVMLEPRTQAKILDALNIQGDELVLDLGCGMGYSAALIAQLAEAVVAIEDDAGRAEEAQQRLSEMGIDNAAVVAGDLAEGAAKHGPYDVIIVEGAVEALPGAIISQLKDGGRLAAIFMEGALGSVRIGTKRDGAVTWRTSFNASAPVLAGFEKARGFAL